MNKRPIAVTILAWLLIAAGTVGFIYHLTDFHAFHRQYLWDTVVIEAIRVLAIIGGAYILQGRDWARWLAVAWIAFHVGVSYFDSWTKVGMHGVILVIFVVVLFMPKASAYFRGRSLRAAT